MVFVVTINNVLNEDTGEVGVVHVEVPGEAEGRALIEEIVREEDGDPADFALVRTTDDWECTGGDGPRCIRPLLN